MPSHIMRLVAAKSIKPFDLQLHGWSIHSIEGNQQIIGSMAINIAKKTQGDVIILRIDPAGAAEATFQQRQLQGKAGWNFQRTKESRHVFLLQGRLPIRLGLENHGFL